MEDESEFDMYDHVPSLPPLPEMWMINTIKLDGIIATLKAISESNSIRDPKAVSLVDITALGRFLLAYSRIRNELTPLLPPEFRQTDE